MLDPIADLATIGLRLDEPAPMRVKICVERCIRAMMQLPEMTRANDCLYTRQLPFEVMRNTTLAGDIGQTLSQAAAAGHAAERRDGST